MSRRRTAFLAGALCCGTLVTIMGCYPFGGFSFTIQFVTPSKAESTETQTFTLPEGALVKVTNDVGSLRVTVDQSATEATVEITKTALADSEADADALLADMTVDITEPTEQDNTLTIVAEKPASATSDDSQFQFTVDGDQINIQSIVGSVVVAQYRLRITLPPGHGVEALQKVGPIKAVALDTASTLQTEAGAIEAVATQADLTATTEAGSIEAEAHQGSLDASTQAGAVDVEVASLAADDLVKVRVESGSIQVRLPSSIAASLRALTELGRVFFAEDDFDAASDVTDTRVFVEATLNGGGASVDVQTEVGSIDVDAY